MFLVVSFWMILVFISFKSCWLLCSCFYVL